MYRFLHIIYSTNLIVNLSYDRWRVTSTLRLTYKLTHKFKFTLNYTNLIHLNVSNDHWNSWHKSSTVNVHSTSEVEFSFSLMNGVIRIKDKQKTGQKLKRKSGSKVHGANQFKIIETSLQQKKIDGQTIFYHFNCSFILFTSKCV